MRVLRARISVSMLSCLGSRCCTRTNAIPVSWGRFVRSSVNASRPPAEAPTPTIGKPSLGGELSTALVTTASGGGPALGPSLSPLGFEGVLPRSGLLLLLFLRTTIRRNLGAVRPVRDPLPQPQSPRIGRTRRASLSVPPSRFRSNGQELLRGGFREGGHPGGFRRGL